MHSSGKLLAAYSNSTGPIHQIYSVDISTSAFGTPVQAYSNISVIQGVSRMAEMADGSILIANAGPTFNTIKQFTLDASSGLLTRTKTLLPTTQPD